MTYEVFFYDGETGKKTKRQVQAYNMTEAVTMAAKEEGMDRYTFRELVCRVRRAKKNG